MKITSIDRTSHAYVEKRIVAALKDLGDELGLSFAHDGGILARNGKHGVFKIKGMVVDASGVAHDPEAETFKATAKFYGLRPEDLGAVFEHQGTRYEITGLSPNRPKYPIDAKRIHDERSFKFPAGVVTNALKAAA